MDVAKLKIEYVPIESVLEDPANARKHGRRNVETLEASLKEFNQLEPFIVQHSTGRLLGGNERWRQLKKLGARHCNIVRIDVDNFTAGRIALVLNRAGELGEWNSSLADQLKALKDEGFDLNTIGFNDEEFDAVLAATTPELPIEALGTEFDETVADKAKTIKCPHCGHEFPG
jgi:ParB-like chromosome segregation protein Spo0J